MRTTLMLIALLAAGCSSAPVSPEPAQTQGATPAPRRLLDQLCFDDCMGDNSGKEFCEDRCTY